MKFNRFVSFVFGVSSEVSPEESIRNSEHYSLRYEGQEIYLEHDPTEKEFKLQTDSEQIAQEAGVIADILFNEENYFHGIADWIECKRRLEDRDIIVDDNVEFFDDDLVEEILKGYSEEGYQQEKPSVEVDKSWRKKVARRLRDLNEGRTRVQVVAASQIAEDSELSATQVGRVLGYWNGKYDEELQPDGDRTNKWHLGLIWDEINELFD